MDVAMMKAKPTTTASARPDNVRIQEWRKWLKENKTNEMVWPFNAWQDRLPASLEEMHAFIHAIVSDVEAMRHESGDFGPFTVTEESEEGSVIEWPNLSILIEKAKELIQ
jgi:hypothetical protein